MEPISLRFKGEPIVQTMMPVYEVVLKIDENGKSATKEIDDYDNCSEDIRYSIEKSSPVELPKRVIKALTSHAIDKILLIDEIPSAPGTYVLDGCSYTIIITKGNLTKTYYADDVSIETYPLLRYLASWYRREMDM